VVRIARGEAKFAHKVVLDLVVDVEEKGHVISMNNFFTFIGLFEDLALKQIYATSTMRSNWNRLPLALKNTRAFKNIP
jgi:hypothetical protein